MSYRTATAISCPNIALIKYWGNIDDDLRLAANPSLSINLGGLYTRTQVSFDSRFMLDQLTINGIPTSGPALDRVRTFLDLVRVWAGMHLHARVESENNFPLGAGIASSASSFAALALAASTAAGLELSEPQLSRLARRGSGSACRSVPAGYVEWLAGPDDASSYAVSVAPPEHWDLHDCIAIVSVESKATGSTEGHAMATSSPLQPARLEGAPDRLERCRQAILSRDFEALAPLVELDSNMMHAVILTSDPPLLYWKPATLEIMRSVQSWRSAGLPVCYTIDAGPNVHVLCPGAYSAEVAARLKDLQGVQDVLTAFPGPGARLES